MAAEAVAAVTATTPVLPAWVKRSSFASESAVFATMAPDWATARKRPAS